MALEEHVSDAIEDGLYFYRIERGTFAVSVVDSLKWLWQFSRSRGKQRRATFGVVSECLSVFYVTDTRKQTASPLRVHVDVHSLKENI